MYTCYRHYTDEELDDTLKETRRILATLEKENALRMEERKKGHGQNSFPLLRSIVKPMVLLRFVATTKVSLLFLQ